MVKRLLIYVLLLLTLSGCGYRFKGRAISLRGVESFNTVIVNNDTYEPELELILRDDITTLFTTNGWLVSNASGDDAVTFLCTVAGYKNSPASHRSNDSISQYEVELRFNVRVHKGPDKEKSIFSLTDRRYSELYIVSDDVNITSKNKREAIGKISDKFARDMEDSLSQGF